MMLTLIAAVALLAPGAAAAEPKADLDALVRQAQTLPPEFAADALIRMAGFPDTGDEMSRKLLEEAFQRAAGAQEPYAMTTSVRGDASLVFLNKAYLQRLDALSLEIRAVRALLPLDKAKARELFTSIPPLRLAALDCAQPLVYDVSAFYETLGAVASSAFTAKEIADQDPIKLLQQYVAGLQYPAQIAPLARLLSSLPLKPEQFALLVAEFSSGLKTISADPRSFSVSESRGAAEGQALLQLAQACRKQQVDPAPLLEAYREYLVHHLQGPACAPPKKEMGGMSIGILSNQDAMRNANALEFFNAMLAPQGGSQVKPLEADDVRPSKVIPAGDSTAGCDRDVCRQIGAQYKGLIFGEDGMPLSNQQRSSEDWRVKLVEYLGKLGDWMPANDAEFRQKCQAFDDLIAIAPGAADREAVLRALVAFLSGNPYAAQHRMQWFLPLNTIIARVFADRATLPHVAQDLLNAGDPVVSLYARLEELSPRSPEVYMPLM